MTARAITAIDTRNDMDEEQRAGGSARAPMVAAEGGDLRCGVAERARTSTLARRELVLDLVAPEPPIDVPRRRPALGTAERA